MEKDLIFGESIEARFKRFQTFMLKFVKDEAGYPIEIKDHQKPWFYHIELNMYALILAPREHGKSTIDKGYILWRVCEDTDLRILIASHKEELSDEFARFIQSYLELSELQAEYGFGKGTPWRIGEAYFRTKGGRIYSHPYMTTVAKQAGVVGKRFDILIMDDLFDDLDVDSEKKRARLERWINKGLFPALDHVKEGRPMKRKWIVLGTRKNVDDWYSRLMTMGHWTVLRDQLYTEDDKGNKTYLWPEKFNEEVEKELRAQMSPAEFAMEYMNEPVPEEGLLFKYEWIEPFFYIDWQEQVPERFREVYMGIDPTMGSETEVASHFGLAVIVYDNRPNKQDIYVVDLVRERLSLPEQQDIIMSKFRQWDPIFINMEEELANRQFTRQVRSQIPRIRPVFYTYRGKTTGLRGTSAISKKKRISQVVGVLFKEGKIHFKDPKICRNTRDFLNYEFLQFPDGSLDLMDALNMAVDLVDFRKAVDGRPMVWIQ